MTGKRLLGLLLQHGFEIIRVRGSHHYIRHADGRSTVIMVHAGEIIGPGLYADILKDIELKSDQLLYPPKRT